MKMRLLLSAALMMPMATFAADAPKLDDVLAKHFDARGGLDDIRALGSYRYSGTMNMAGMQMPFTSEAERPGKLRVEFTAQGMTGIQAVDGDSGWQVMPFMGMIEPTPMGDDDLRNFRNQADIEGPLVGWQAKGHQVEVVGAGEIDGADVVTLKVKLASGDDILIHLDAERYLDLKWEITSSMRGQPIRMSMDFGDYKPVGGLTLPHSINQSIEGMPGTQSIVIDAYEVNVDIDDSRFRMPAKPEAASAD